MMVLKQVKFNLFIEINKTFVKYEINFFFMKLVLLTVDLYSILFILKIKTLLGKKLGKFIFKAILKLNKKVSKAVES